MAKPNFPRPAAIVLLAGVLTAPLLGCASSPLYVPPKGMGTGGEVPRDGRGEPLWAVIQPSPSTEVRQFPIPVMPPAGFGPPPVVPAPVVPPPVVPAPPAVQTVPVPQS